MQDMPTIACASLRVLTREGRPPLPRRKGNGSSETSQSGLPWAVPSLWGVAGRRYLERPELQIPDGSPIYYSVGLSCRP